MCEWTVSFFIYKTFAITKGEYIMGKKLEGIDFKAENGKPYLDSEMSDYILPFDKPQDYFLSYESRQRFIQETKRLVRRSKGYKYFKSQILKRIPYDQINPNFSEENGCTLEMHHGPIFELVEIIDILIDAFLYYGKEVTTMTIADAVLKEHYEGRVQVMILAKTSHEIVTNRQVYINLNQFIGDVKAFMDKYEAFISNDKKREYNDIIMRSEAYNSNDFDMYSTQKIYKQFVEEE